METYLAYFDILGFKDFIYNTAQDEIDFKFDCLLRDSQSSITDDKFISDLYGGLVPDLKQSRVNCLHVSDSIIFWTSGVSKEQFAHIIDVSNDFFQCCCVNQTFPVRGCIVKGIISFDPFTIKSQKELKFINSSIYGKALIDAYIKAELQEWAGCYIDKSVFEGIDEIEINALIASGKILKYPVPFKDQIVKEEFTIKMIGEKRDNISEIDVQKLFTQHLGNNPITTSIQKKLDNTLKYFKYIKQL